MIEQILVKRSNWEDIVKRYNIPDHNGTIDNLKWFVDHGHQSNRLRRRFKEARDIAHNIIELADLYDRSDISNTNISTTSSGPTTNPDPKRS